MTLEETKADVRRIFKETALNKHGRYELSKETLNSLLEYVHALGIQEGVNAMRTTLKPIIAEPTTAPA